VIPGATSSGVETARSDGAERGSPSAVSAENGVPRLASRLFLASVAVAVLPITVATARAIRRGWLPVGDNALLAIRTRDVLTEHHPLLGTWSSASRAEAIDFNNPGPLLYDVLALPARLFDGGAGVAVGVGIVNGLAVLGIAVVAHRRGGPLLATAAMAVTAALSWAMGSEVLFEPWQPHSMLLPFLCFLMLVWSLACGDVVVLPWAVGVGSVVLQTHLSYGYLVPALGAWGVLALILELRNRARRDPGSWPRLRRRAMGAAVIAGFVFAASWAQPLAEAFTSDGEGNLFRLRRGISGSAATVGYGRGARLIASVVSLPPWWFRPSFNETFGIFEGWQVPSAGAAAASLAVLAVALAWCVRDARRRRDGVSSRAVATGGVALLAGLVTAGRLPVSGFPIAPHQFRWLWPVAAFTFFAVLATFARRIGRRAQRATRLVGALAVATAVFALLNLPTSNQSGQGGGPNAYRWAIPVARELGRQMAGLEGEGTLLVDLRDAGFDDPSGAAVLAELQHRGVQFVVDDPVLLRTLGSSRRFAGDAQARLVVKTGDDARVAPPGARRVALHESLTAREQLELSHLKESIEEYIRDGRLQVTREVEAARQEGDPSTPRRESSSQDVDPEALLASRELVALVRVRGLVLDDRWERRFERYADLQTRWDKQRVAVFVGPLGAGAEPPDPQP
jgi:hypothetical protein